MGRNRAEYLEGRGWRRHSGSGSSSYWVRPGTGRIYIRRFAMQIQRGDDRKATDALTGRVGKLWYSEDSGTRETA